MSNDRRGWAPPRDTDGVPLLDTGAAQLLTGHRTPAGFTKWAASHGMTAARRGAHNAQLWRHSDIIDALDEGGDAA